MSLCTRYCMRGVLLQGHRLWEGVLVRYLLSRKNDWQGKYTRSPTKTHSKTTCCEHHVASTTCYKFTITVLVSNEDTTRQRDLRWWALQTCISYCWGSVIQLIHIKDLVGISLSTTTPKSSSKSQVFPKIAVLLFTRIVVRRMWC